LHGNTSSLEMYT